MVQGDGAPDRCALEINRLDDAAAAVDQALQQLHTASQDLYRCRYGDREVNAALEWNNESDIDGGPLSRELRADAIMIQRQRKFVAEFVQDKKQ
jgi:hypothetical protein